MSNLELKSGNGSAALELLLRGAVYAMTGLVTLMLVALFGFAVLIAVGGTGGFTSSPPPEHPAWLGLTITLCLYALLQWGLIRLHGYLLASLGRRFGGSGS